MTNQQKIEKMEFTIRDITAAHQNVKSGAGFPQYIQAVKSPGISHDTTFDKEQNEVLVE